jgi:hypothetical protein
MKIQDLKSTVYTIYHIPGKKIGCSNEPNKRVKDQGFDSYEVLERHFDIEVASEREMDLQKEYGYRVDTVPYWLSLTQWMNSRKGAKHTEESKLKMSESKKGSKPTDETKKKISDTLKGKPNGWLGLNHSSESKLKISDSKKGTKWYTNGVTSIQIKTENIPDGFYHGRKIKK